MNIEKQQKIEQIGKNRERLLLLEKEGRYVFHGSSDIIESIEPWQAYNQNKETGEMEKDGNPAIFATPYADVAIFRALIQGTDLENEFGIDDNGQLHFIADKKLIERVKNKIGKVYVLDKSKFGNFRGLDCKNEEAIIPIEVIEITVNDLPKNIKILE